MFTEKLRCDRDHIDHFGVDVDVGDHIYGFNYFISCNLKPGARQENPGDAENAEVREANMALFNKSSS